ncbi:hypothetical protein B0I37DRAFT_412142 [Chaetomium sp. MPI-CAGE-AT-0009]|nr:hypothetical protein B0I37DRAFT_412142 [Chaetomium sp. MPI-CAGE-AT-0009]
MNRPCGRHHRNPSSHRRHDYAAELVSTATTRPSSRHGNARVRSSSVGSGSGSSGSDSARSRSVPVAGLDNAQELRGRSEARGNRRDAVRPWNVRQLAAFVGVFVAGLLAVLSATSLLVPPPNAISRLRPELVNIRAKPFPLADLAMVSERYASASDAISNPHRDLNVTLALDAPGLVRVNVASWLPKTTLYLGSGLPGNPSRKNGTRLPAERVPYIVDYLNITVTLEMLSTLWPVLLHAATDLLAAGLGREHPEYPSLRGPLFRLGQKNGRDFLAIAGRMWGRLDSKASSWPHEAEQSRMMAWLEGVSKTTAARAVAQNESTSSPSQLTIGSRAPTFQELLEYDGGRGPIHGTLSEHRVALGMNGGGPGAHGLCRDQDAHDLLRAVAESRCSGNHTTKLRHYLTSNADPTDYDSVAGLWDALCDVESFLSYVQALAEGVRDRVGAAVGERGGFSLCERIAGHFSKDGIVRRTDTLNQALHTFHSLRLGLRPQTWMLANMAAKMLRACELQDELRQHAKSLDGNQSAWWHLQWDDVLETADLAFVTFPPAQETITELRVAMDQIKARVNTLSGTWYMARAVDELKQVVLPGWIDRLGLNGLPLEPRQADTEFDYPYPPNSRMANSRRILKERKKGASNWRGESTGCQNE